MNKQFKQVIFWAVILHIGSSLFALTTSIIQTRKIIKKIKEANSR